MKKLIILSITLLLIATSCNLKMTKLKNTVACYKSTELLIYFAEENLLSKEQELQRNPSLSNDEIFMKSISNERETIIREKKDLRRYYATIKGLMKSINLDKYYSPSEMYVIEDANKILKNGNP